MMGNYFGGGYGFMGGFGFFFMLLFWGLVLWGIIALVQSVSDNRNQPSGTPQEDAAMKTLRERYAKGEITKAEFDQMKKDLAA
jgi:putative membrane protein